MQNATKYVFLLGLFCSALCFTQCQDTKQNTQQTDPVEQIIDTIAKVVPKEKPIRGTGLPTTQAKERGKVYSIDEGSLNNSFAKFRSRLFDIIDKKDTTALMALIDPNIELSNEEKGRAILVQQWNLGTKPQHSFFWKTLKDVLRLGGTFDDDEQSVFTAPYLYTSFSGGDGDSSEAAILGSGVRIRVEPKRNAKVVAKLNHDIVKILPQEGRIKKERIGQDVYPWVKIQTPTGKEGYVYGKFIRTQNDYHASFEKVGNTWRMWRFAK